MSAAATAVRFAVITDVHANLPALDAALAAIDAAGCDFLVHTGDAIGIGPYPAETLDRLLGRADIRCVMGNHDALFAFGLPKSRPDWMSAAEEAHHRWTHAQIPPLLRHVVRQWPYRRSIELHGRVIAFCHYPRTAEQCWNEGREQPEPLLASGFASIIANPASGDLAELFRDYPADLVFYGHHHPPSDLTARARYVNPGALGCSHTPVARYGLVRIRANGEIEVDLRAVPYDRAGLLAAFDERAVPARTEIRSIFFGAAASWLRNNGTGPLTGGP